MQKTHVSIAATVESTKKLLALARWHTIPVEYVRDRNEQYRKLYSAVLAHYKMQLFPKYYMTVEDAYTHFGHAPRPADLAKLFLLLTPAAYLQQAIANMQAVLNTIPDNLSEENILEWLDTHYQK